MAETKTPGQIAFEGYAQKSEGKDFVTSAPLPNWVSPSVNKAAWEAAALAVMTQPNVEPPKPVLPVTQTPAKPYVAPVPPNFPPRPNLVTKPEPSKAPVQSKPARTDPQSETKSIPTPPSPAKSRTSS